MVKITTRKEKNTIRFVVEGKLDHASISVMQRCWSEAKSLPHLPEILFEFADITFVDESAQRLLKRMAASGVKLLARDIQMKGIVEKINRSKNQEENNEF